MPVETYDGIPEAVLAKQKECESALFDLVQELRDVKKKVERKELIEELVPNKKLLSENKEMAQEIEDKIFAAVKAGAEITGAGEDDDEPGIKPVAPESIRPHKSVDIDIAVED